MLQPSGTHRAHRRTLGILRQLGVICSLPLAVGISPALAAPSAASATPSAPSQSDTSANPARTEALRLVREGAKLFEAGQFGAALAKFETAFARFPAPKIQFNIGQAQRKLGRPVAATIAFESFLRGVEQPTSEDRTLAEAAIRELSPQVARLEIAIQPAGTSVRLDGAPLGDTPLPAPIVVAPGPHELYAERTGHQPLRDSIIVSGGQKARIDRSLVMAPIAGASLPSPAPSVTSVSPTNVPAADLASGVAVPVEPSPASTLASTGRQTVGKILLGSAVAFATGGVVLMFASRSAYDSGKKDGCGYCPDKADSIDRYKLWSKVMFGASVVTAVPGATLILLGPPPTGNESSVPGPLGLGISGRF